MHYFDNAATTFPKPEVVYSAMDSFYRSIGVNVGRGQYQAASMAFSIVEETRKMVLDLFHASYGYSCVFTPSATEALNVILQGISWHEGMNVYVSPFEHNAVIRTLNSIVAAYRINVITLYPYDGFAYDLNDITAAFMEKKPDVVVLTHASNVFGNILPVEEIFCLAKQYNAVTICDMAQTAGLVDIDIKKAKIDYSVFAGHKTLYGPFGVAGFVTNKFCELKPLVYGGTGVNSSDPNMPKEMPTKYEAGSLNSYAIAGLHASLKWIRSTGINNIRATEQQVTKKLLSVLRKHKNIRILRNSKEAECIGVVSCVFDGYSSDSIGQIMSDHGIAVRTGLHCAPLAHKHLKTFPSGTVRFSVGFFTSEEDLTCLESVLAFIELNS